VVRVHTRCFTTKMRRMLAREQSLHIIRGLLKVNRRPIKLIANN
jgi:hypothetical protein